MKNILNSKIEKIEYPKDILEEIKKLKDCELLEKFRNYRTKTGVIEPFLFRAIVERGLI